MRIEQLIEKPIRRLVYLVTNFSQSVHVEDVKHYSNILLNSWWTDAAYYRLTLKYFAAYARLCWGDLPDEVRVLVEFFEDVNDFLKENDCWQTNIANKEDDEIDEDETDEGETDEESNDTDDETDDE